MTLVIMAAGMGSRYGGLKQIDPIGKNGEFIVDYSIFDAINAGFTKVVFIIKEENLAAFQETVGDRISKSIEVVYVFQRITDIPAGFSIPADRTKPLGTSQAVLACKGVVNEPFAVINADDFYGKETFTILADFLKNVDTAAKPHRFCMVGFVLDNTLTDNGHVARGVCEVDANGFLTKVDERIRIERVRDEVKYFEGDDSFPLKKDATVSMNCWGFTPALFDEIEADFPRFLNASKDNLMKAEFLLPVLVDDLVSKKDCTVQVINTSAKWYGVTYHEDKERVIAYVQSLVESGVYPS